MDARLLDVVADLKELFKQKDDEIDKLVKSLEKGKEAMAGSKVMLDLAATIINRQFAEIARLRGISPGELEQEKIELLRGWLSDAGLEMEEIDVVRFNRGFH